MVGSALSSPTELSYGSLLLPMQNDSSAVSPTLDTDSFHLLFVLPTKCAIRFFYLCVASSEWSCREKENTLSL